MKEREEKKTRRKTCSPCILITWCFIGKTNLTRIFTNQNQKKLFPLLSAYHKKSSCYATQVKKKKK